MERGVGRLGISLRRPPLPIKKTSDDDTGRPQKRRCNIQSNPLSFGERAHPGTPNTGILLISPISIRFPGSTGIPKCLTVPDNASIEDGIISRRSATADEPTTSTISAPALSCLEMALARISISCSQRSSKANLLPIVSRRWIVTLEVLSRTFSPVPGRVVWINPTLCGLAAQTSNLPFRACSSASVNSVPDTAKGITFTVATICPGFTSALGGKAARVSDSSTELRQPSHSLG